MNKSVSTESFSDKILNPTGYIIVSNFDYYILESY